MTTTKSCEQSLIAADTFLETFLPFNAEIMADTVFLENWYFRN